MKGDHGYIDPGQKRGDNQGSIAQKADEDAEGQRFKIIIGGLHRHSQIGGDDEGKWSPLGHDHHPPLEEGGGDLVGPFGAVAHREKGVGVVLDKVL